jgi:hypothetical protein
MKAALREATRAVDVARAYRADGEYGWALHQLAQVHLRTNEEGGIARAEECYREALGVATSRGMRPLQAHCHLGLGRLHAVAGRRADAERALTVARDLYREMEMTPYLREAELALDLCSRDEDPSTRRSRPQTAGSEGPPG